MNSDDVTCTKCGEVYPDLEAMTGYKVRECPECGEPRDLGTRKPPSDMADDFDKEDHRGPDDPWGEVKGSPWCHGEDFETIDEDDENF